MGVAAILNRNHHRYIPVLLAAGADPCRKAVYRSRPIGGSKLSLDAHALAAMNAAADMAPVPPDVLALLAAVSAAAALPAQRPLDARTTSVAPRAATGAPAMSVASVPQAADVDGHAAPPADQAD